MKKYGKQTTKSNGLGGLLKIIQKALNKCMHVYGMWMSVSNRMNRVLQLFIKKLLTIYIYLIICINYDTSG